MHLNIVLIQNMSDSVVDINKASTILLIFCLMITKEKRR